MWESAAPLLVAEDQRRVLEGWRRAPSTPQGVALRASVILMAADGVPNRTIAKPWASVVPPSCSGESASPAMGPRP